MSNLRLVSVESSCQSCDFLRVGRAAFFLATAFLEGVPLVEEATFFMSGYFLADRDRPVADAGRRGLRFHRLLLRRLLLRIVSRSAPGHRNLPFSTEQLLKLLDDFRRFHDFRKCRLDQRQHAFDVEIGVSIDHTFRYLASHGDDWRPISSQSSLPESAMERQIPQQAVYNRSIEHFGLKRQTPAGDIDINVTGRMA